MRAGVPSEAASEPPGLARHKRSSFSPPPPAELAPHFPQLQILELLGHGGMGAVYKARQKQLDRLVALKILPPAVSRDASFAERFTREARALAKLNHPHIVTLYEFGQVDGLFFFLMEYVDGLDLGRLLEAGHMAPKEALAIVPQICEALQCAHDCGIVHRDIKPTNILLSKGGHVKIADFGLAKLVGQDISSDEAPLTSQTAAEDGSPALARQPNDTLTRAGRVMGTPTYMAPEQVTNPSEVDHRADIYALGVVFYQMLTGKLPDKRIEPPSKKVQIDVRLDEVVLRALEKDPALRYAQAGALRTAVETIAMTEGASPADPSAGRLGSAVNKSTRRADLIRLLEKEIVLPVRLAIVLFLGCYIFSLTWRAPFWSLVEGVFLVYAALSLFNGGILVLGRSLSRSKLEWLVLSGSGLDAVLLGMLAFLTDGYNTYLYWFFAVLILHNAVASPVALLQIPLNLFVCAAYITGGILDRKVFVTDPGVLQSPESPVERVAVLVAWALGCYAVQVLLEKQKQSGQTESGN